MTEFPRTAVGGVSLPRMIIGSNWFLGYSHTSRAKDRFIQKIQNLDRIRDVLAVFLEEGIDAIMGPPSNELEVAIRAAEDQTGRGMMRILTPLFNSGPGGPFEQGPEQAFDRCKELGATFCMPHQCVTDTLLDREAKVIRNLDAYSAMIRERGMLPGLSTHAPETVVIADKSCADIETYIQIYNAAGFLMHVEADWVMRTIVNARHPVMVIKPLGAGRLLPLVGLAFVWNTIRDQDMVTIGTTTPDEAREVIDLSWDLLSHRLPRHELQWTRSKFILTE